MASEFDFRFIERRLPTQCVLAANFNNGSASDQSNLANNVTLVNGATVTSGYLSTSNPTYDGVNECAQYADRPEYTFASGGNDLPFSVSAWVYLATLPTSGNRAMLVAKRPSGATTWEWDFWAELLFNTLGPALILRKSDASAIIGRYVSSPLSATTWYHLVATYSGSKASTGIKIYINAVRSDNTDNNSGSYTGMSDTSGPITVGDSFIGGMGHPLNGRVDNLLIFGKELSASEVTELYNQGRANP